jgi:predicted DNA-binding protein
MATSSQPGSETGTRISVMVSDARKRRLNEIAWQESEPSDRVTASDVVREAIEDYVDKYESDPEACDPQERGCIGPGTSEGVADA